MPKASSTEVTKIATMQIGAIYLIITLYMASRLNGDDILTSSLTVLTPTT